MVDRGIPRQHYKIAHAGEEVGEVTSGSMSPLLGIGIGMGYVPVALAKPGQQLDIVVRNKHLKAEVVKAPFIEK